MDMLFHHNYGTAHWDGSSKTGFTRPRELAGIAIAARILKRLPK